MACALVAATSAAAATSGSGLYLQGAGSGHGVGMSQYGAAGYALHGVGYQDILRDYYAGTTLGHIDPNQPVTVLLRPRGSAVFSGASTIKGSTRKLNPLATYNVEVAATGLRLMLGAKRLGVFPAPLEVGGPGPVKLNGLGDFRGDFVFRPSPGGGGVMTVNSVGIDDYVRGVVAAEMPSNWPTQALEAQAVAARSFAVTSHPLGASFDVYDNTRSQVYEGVKAETPASDAAVAATSGQVVEYAGTPVATYFFASSGGETESDQNVFPATAPASWLVGRPDPYDDAFNNPYHRWKVSFSLQGAQARLGKLVDGSLIGIKVLQRGVSPRIIKAKIVGTKGSVIVTGIQLRTALGTPSTWMSFTTVSSHGVQTSTTPGATTTLPIGTTPGTTTTVTGTTTGPPSGGGGLGGSIRAGVVTRAVVAGGLVAPVFQAWDLIRSLFAGLRPPPPTYTVTGIVFPAARGARVHVQVEAGESWRHAGTGRLGANGHYSVRVRRPGTYRVRYGATTGPEITVG